MQSLNLRIGGSVFFFAPCTVQLVDSMPLNLGFNANIFKTPGACSSTLLRGFPILFKIISGYCDVQLPYNYKLSKNVFFSHTHISNQSSHSLFCYKNLLCIKSFVSTIFYLPGMEEFGKRDSKLDFASTAQSSLKILWSTIVTEVHRKN